MDVVPTFIYWFLLDNALGNYEGGLPRIRPDKTPFPPAIMRTPQTGFEEIAGALQWHHFPDLDASPPVVAFGWRRAFDLCKALLKESTS